MPLMPEPGSTANSAWAQPARYQRRHLIAGHVYGHRLGVGLALIPGIYLATIATICGPWLFALGIISLICAVAYTGGPFPLAYHGLGDLFVLLFFGLFAVLGSAWVQAPDLGLQLWPKHLVDGSLGPGLTGGGDHRRQ